jgi:hypothetical protein
MAFDVNDIKKQAMAGLGVKSKAENDVEESNTTIDRLTAPVAPERWNEVHTYFFAVAYANEDGSVSNNYKPPGANKLHGPLQVGTAFTNQLLTDGEASPVAELNFSRTSIPLVIPPQAMSISVQFASSVQATNRGILEENNGVVFRTISISGTTGVWRARPSEKDLPGPKSGSFDLGRLFPAATAAVNHVKYAVHSVLGTLSAKSNDLDTEDLKHTGYYQFWALHNFFLEYAHNKKKAGTAPLRLLFASPKDNITYVVTPMQFDLRRDANNPLQYKYSITLRAWDVTTANATLTAALDQVPDGKNPLSIRDVAERIRRARRAINQAAEVIKAVQSDVFEAMNLINQAVLAVKDVVGVAYDIADFPQTLKNSADAMIASNKAQWTQVFAGRKFEPTKTAAFAALGSPIPLALGNSQVFGQASSKTSASESGDVTNLKAATSGSDEVTSTGFSNSSPTGEKASPDLTDSGGASLIVKYINTPALAETTALEELGSLPAAVQDSIDQQIADSKEVTAKDVQVITAKLKEISENLAYANGLMDPTYATIFGLPAPHAAGRTPTEDDLLLIAQIEDGRDAFIATLATGTVYGEKKDNPFTAASKVSKSKVPTPISAIPVFVQRGSNLDDIAKYYLGDPNRAREIAILNELRAPYIDEAGFDLPIFLSSGRTFVVNDRSKLVANQAIRISGSGLTSTRRNILAIEDIGGGQFRITVDGKENLDIYSPSHSPTLNARAPGTVGSGDTILIPSASQPQEEIVARQTPLLERMTHAEKTFRVDIALDDNGDLALGPDGDLAKSYGYKNAVQALRIAVETEKGELEQHREYGLDAGIGDTLSGAVLSQIQDSIKNTITSDPRFQNAGVVAVVDGTALNIRIDAVGSNGTGLIPIEFKVNT